MSETRRVASPRRPDAGTTLVEALVVVAITALVAEIGFPRLQQQLLTLSQHQTAAMVAARLRQTRADALRRDGPVVFTIAPDGRTYGPANGPAVSAAPGVRLAVQAPASGQITFYGDGSSSGGRILVAAAGRALPVTVTQDTGVVWADGS